MDERFQPRRYNDFLHLTLDLALATAFLGLARGAVEVVARTRNEISVLGSPASRLWQAEAFADAVARDADVVHTRRAEVDDWDEKVDRARARAVLDRSRAVADQISNRVFAAVGTADDVQVELAP